MVSLSVEDYEDNETNLRSDELQTRELPPCLFVDDILDLGVDLRERTVFCETLWFAWSLMHISRSIGCSHCSGG
jgi:hypothetical protein